MEILELFPSKIFTRQNKDFELLKDKLINYVYDYASNNASADVSNMGGWQSQSQIYQEDSFLPFRQMMWQNLLPFIDAIKADFESLGNSPIVEPSSAWFNINYPGSYNMIHTHPHSVYSGVMWMQVSENCGNLVLNDPSKHNVFGTVSTDYEFVPEVGKMVVFPSHLPHRVLENKSDQDRISCSFNFCI